MGVHGLSKWLRKNASALGERANLGGRAIVCDGTCLAYKISAEVASGLASSSPSWAACALCGDYVSLYGAFRDFLLALLRAPCSELRVVLDSPCLRDPSHGAATLKRRKRQVAGIRSLLESLQDGTWDPVELAPFATQVAPLPLFAEDVLAVACLDLGIPCLSAEMGADSDIVRISTTLERGIVLSNDTDFLLFRSGAQPMNLIPLWSVEIEYNGSDVWGHIYSAERLAKLTKLRRDSLPLLACLAGNDVIDPDNWGTRARVWNFTRETAGLNLKQRESNFFLAASYAVKRSEATVTEAQDDNSALIAQAHALTELLFASAEGAGKSTSKKRRSNTRKRNRSWKESGGSDGDPSPKERYFDAVEQVLRGYCWSAHKPEHNVTEEIAVSDGCSRTRARAWRALRAAAELGVPLWFPLVVDKGLAWDSLGAVRGRLLSLVAGQKLTNVVEMYAKANFCGYGSVERRSLPLLLDKSDVAANNLARTCEVLLCGNATPEDISKAAAARHDLLSKYPTEDVDVTVSLVIATALEHGRALISPRTLWAFLKTFTEASCREGIRARDERVPPSAAVGFAQEWSALMVVIWHVHAALSAFNLYAHCAVRILLLIPLERATEHSLTWETSWRSWADMAQSLKEEQREDERLCRIVCSTLL